ncbi:MAG: hypothetical protein DA329_02295 [Candidatus Nitrosocosmicus sp.]|jgi:hypothetical protein|nr:hypothetical protein [Candidatus Nitrosocosmicus sp.]
MRYETPKSILDLIPDNNSISRIAYNASNRIPKEFLILWFKEIDVDSYIHYLHLVCRYTIWPELKIDGHAIGEYIATFIQYVGENSHIQYHLFGRVGIQFNVNKLHVSHWIPIKRTYSSSRP